MTAAIEENTQLSSNQTMESHSENIMMQQHDNPLSHGSASEYT